MSHSNQENYNREYDEMIEAIGNNPKFYEVVKKKQTFSLTLLALTLGLYIILMLAVAFAPNLVGMPISKDSITTWGIPAGFFLIIWTTILTGYYISRTNKVYDPMTENLVKETADETLK